MSLRNYLSRRAFKKAKRKLRDDEVLCATYAPGGKPIYFPMPAEAGEVEVRNEAFKRRNGRPMTPLEESLLAVAQERRRA